MTKNGPKSSSSVVHHVVLALPLREMDHRDVAGLGVVADRGDELPVHRGHQRGRGDREPPVAHQVPRDLPGALQLRDEDVEVHPVDALDLEPDVISHHVADRAR